MEVSDKTKQTRKAGKRSQQETWGMMTITLWEKQPGKAGHLSTPTNTISKDKRDKTNKRR
eukprot:12902161-Prorocentrum_lima.AAC.1